MRIVFVQEKLMMSFFFQCHRFRRPISLLFHLLTDKDPPPVIVQRHGSDDGARIATLQRWLQAKLHPGGAAAGEREGEGRCQLSKRKK
jgi:hypothetical protein